MLSSHLVFLPELCVYFYSNQFMLQALPISPSLIILIVFGEYKL
jgi:hypothetical protein